MINLNRIKTSTRMLKRLFRFFKPPLTFNLTIGFKTRLRPGIWKANRGFSLPELITVLALVGILSVVAIPLGRKFIDRMHLRITADNIKNQLFIARMRAISDPNVPCGVYFDITSSPRKTFIFLDQSGGIPYTYDKDIDTRILKEILMPEGVTLKIPTIAGVTNNSVVFRGDGSAKTGGNVELSDRSGKVRRINVLPSTGRVKFFLN